MIPSAVGEDEREQEWKKDKHFHRKSQNAGHYCRNSLSRKQRQGLSSKMCARLMQQDDAFDTIILDPCCFSLNVAPGEHIATRTTRVLHAWIEDWEDKDIGPQCNPVREQHILHR